MHEADAMHAPRHPLLDVQLRLLEDRRADIADLLLERGGEGDETLVDAVANDLVGARLVIQAALAAPSPCGISGAAREDLRHREQEAGELLRVVLALLSMACLE